MAAIDDLKAELEKRKGQLKVREGKSGWGDNVRDLKLRITDLEAQIAAAE